MATQSATVEVKLTVQNANLKRGLKGAEDSLGKTKKKSEETQKALTRGGKGIQEQFRRASQSIAAIQGPLGPVAGRITSLGTIIGNVGLKIAAITVGFAALTFAIRGTVGMMSRAEVQFAKLEAIINATGSAAGKSLADIEALAQEIGIGTLGSTQKIRDAAGILLTFKSISGEVFNDALRLSQDLATVGFGDVKQGAIQLGKALEEPIVGLGALRRVGVSFTEDQKELIKVLSMTGRKAEAQRIILKALETQVGGAGKKAAEGLAGAIDSVSESFVIFFEETKGGRILVNGLTKALNGLANIIQILDKDLSAINTEEGLKEFIKKTSDEITELENLSKPKKLKVFGFEFNMSQTEFAKTLLATRGIQFDVESEIEKKLQEIADAHAKIFEIQNKEKKAEEGLAKAIEAEKNKKTDADKVAEKSLNNQIRAQERLRENVGKTTKEIKILNEARKLEDALRAKLGDSPFAQDEIRDQVRENIAQIETQIELTEKFNKVQTAIQSTVGILQKEFDNLSASLAKAFVTGQTEGLKFKNILQSLGQQLVKTILDLVIFNQLKAGVETIGGKVGSAILGRIFGGRRTGATGEITSDAGFSNAATGGAVGSRQAMLVGERGPELFVPNQAGRIIPSSLTPNAMGGGGGIVINQSLNFATGISNTVKAEILNLMPTIQNQTISAVAEAKQRGGAFAKAFR